ncbi:MAG: hypothetical protein KIT10_16140 [Flavobacteriales bacterium]|nr:hypothetical protein [Flavobacteriales bacterium]
MDKSKLPTIVLALLMLATLFLVYQNYRLRVSLDGLRFDACARAETQCRGACDQVRDQALMSARLDSGLCVLPRHQRITECQVRFVNDPAARSQCIEDVEADFQRCIAPSQARKARALEVHESCLADCAARLRDCHRQDLFDQAQRWRDRFMEIEKVVDPRQPPRPGLP